MTDSKKDISIRALPDGSYEVDQLGQSPLKMANREEVEQWCLEHDVTPVTPAQLPTSEQKAAE